MKKEFKFKGYLEQSELCEVYFECKNGKGDGWTVLEDTSDIREWIKKNPKLRITGVKNFVINNLISIKL